MSAPVGDSDTPVVCAIEETENGLKSSATSETTAASAEGTVMVLRSKATKAPLGQEDRVDRVTSDPYKQHDGFQGKEDERYLNHHLNHDGDDDHAMDNEGVASDSHPRRSHSRGSDTSSRSEREGVESTHNHGEAPVVGREEGDEEEYLPSNAPGGSSSRYRRRRSRGSPGTEEDEEDESETHRSGRAHLSRGKGRGRGSRSGSAVSSDGDHRSHSKSSSRRYRRHRRRDEEDGRTNETPGYVGHGDEDVTPPRHDRRRRRSPLSRRPDKREQSSEDETSHRRRRHRSGTPERADSRSSRSPSRRHRRRNREDRDRSVDSRGKYTRDERSESTSRQSRRRHASRSRSSRRRHRRDASNESPVRGESQTGSSVAGSAGGSASGTSRKRRTGWDSGPAAPTAVPTILSTLGTSMTPTTTGFTASLAGKTPEQIQAELAERQAQAASIAASMQMKASTSQMCRIYVGSLDYSLTDYDIRQVFSAFGPITNIDMPKEGTRSKGFCFVEYATPESAEMAISTMPGFNLKGRAIKVGRPTALGGQSNSAVNAMSMLAGGLNPVKAGGVNAAEAGHAVGTSGAQGQIAAAMLLAKTEAGGGLQQSESQNRVYVGSVPYNFTSDDIKQIFDVFGTIVSCQLIPSNERPGTHRGYGFIEYSSFEEAKLAIDTMNDFPVAGKVLKVNYATALRGGGSVYQPPPMVPPGTAAALLGISAAATGANAVPMPMMNFPQVTAASLPSTVATGGLGVGSITAPQLGAVRSVNTTMPLTTPTVVPTPVLSPPATTTAPTAPDLSQSTVLLLCNTVDAKEANQELHDEIQQECSKFGTVQKVDIVVHPATREVRIFVVFQSPSHVAAAVPVLHDRWFGGRKIAARPYDPAAYAAQNQWL